MICGYRFTHGDAQAWRVRRARRNVIRLIKLSHSRRHEDQDANVPGNESISTSFSIHFLIHFHRAQDEASVTALPNDLMGGASVPDRARAGKRSPRGG
jgi:hypothetical protein